MHSERYHHLCLRESGLADETTQPLAFKLVKKTSGTDEAFVLSVWVWFLMLEYYYNILPTSSSPYYLCLDTP